MNSRHPNVRILGLLIITAVAVTIVGGCKKSPESQVVGTWKAKNASFTFKDDKTFSQNGGPKPAIGKWTVADKKVSINIDSIGGKTVDEAIAEAVKAKLIPEAMADKAREQAKKPTVLTLSDDGKTMTMDGVPASAAADATLTKQ